MGNRLQEDIQTEFILNSIPGFVTWIDRDLNYLGVNDELLRFFSLEKKDFIGKKLGTVTSGNNERLIEYAEKLFAGNEDKIQCEIHYEKEEEDFWNLLTLKKINDGENALLISIDITEFKRAEMKLKEEQANAFHNARLVTMGEMIGTITHEINNPLAVLSLNNSALEKVMGREPLDTSKIHKLIELNEKSFTKINSIIASVRNLVRDGSHDEHQEIEVQAILDDITLFITKKCQSNDIEFTIENKFEANSLKCNPTQISQALIVLLNNSIDAIEGQKNKWIKLVVESVQESVLFSVIDSGPGIPAEIQRKIFNSFFTTKKMGKGTGIGLGLAKKVATAHQGEIKIDNDSSTTKFDLILPH